MRTYNGSSSQDSSTNTVQYAKRDDSNPFRDFANANGRSMNRWEILWNI